MNAVTAVASSGSSQMESSHAAAEESRMDAAEKDRGEFRSSKVQNIRRRIMKNTSVEESQMDDEGKERDEYRRSTELNTRRRVATKTSLEESTREERKVAVTTQESLDGIREKATRIASTDELETGSKQCRNMVQPRREQRMTRQGKPPSLWGQITKEGDMIVASDSK